MSVVVCNKREVRKHIPQRESAREIAKGQDTTQQTVLVITNYQTYKHCCQIQNNNKAESKYNKNGAMKESERHTAFAKLISCCGNNKSDHKEALPLGSLIFRFHGEGKLASHCAK